jgi:hypothetical protein
MPSSYTRTIQKKSPEKVPIKVPKKGKSRTEEGLIENEAVEADRDHCFKRYLIPHDSDKDTAIM